jgi:hypothetical protein
MVLRSIKVLSSETPFERLPGDISEDLRPEELVVYKTGPSYFAERADQCAYRPMRKFFRLLGSAKSFRLNLYGGLEPVYYAYFGFKLLKRTRYVRFDLAPRTYLAPLHRDWPKFIRTSTAP